MVAIRIAARIGDRLRQAIIEALVHLNIGVVGEEVDLIAVIELEAGIQEGLDAVGGWRAPLLHRTRVMRQLRSEIGIGLSERQGGGARRVANRLLILGPFGAQIHEALAAQGQPYIRRQQAVASVARVTGRKVFSVAPIDLDAAGTVSKLIVENARDGIRAVLRGGAVA